MRLYGARTRGGRDSRCRGSAPRHGQAPLDVRGGKPPRRELGYIVDAKAAKSVLLAVTKILDLELDMTALEERARETEEILRKVQEMQRAMLEQGMPSTPPEEEDRGYL